MKRLNEGPSGVDRHGIDRELVERCKRGDQAAWKALVDATNREVYTLCLRILRNPDDAAEAAQDAYVKAWRGIKSFRGDAQFSTWLYRIATNAAVSKYRSRKTRRRFEAGVEDEQLSAIASPASTEDSAGARLDLARLESALGRLPEPYRDAVTLRDVYGLSIHELARQLHISETAAKVRVHRGRKKLMDLWDRGDVDEV